MGTDDETRYLIEMLVKLVLTEVNTGVTFRPLRVLQLHCDEHNNYNIGPFKSDFQSQNVQTRICVLWELRSVTLSSKKSGFPCRNTVKCTPATTQHAFPSAV